MSNGRVRCVNQSIKWSFNWAELRGVGYIFKCYRPSYMSRESAFVFNVSKEMRGMQQQEQQQPNLGQLIDVPVHARYCSPIEQPAGSCIRDVDIRIEMYLIGEKDGRFHRQNLTISMRWKIPSVCIRFKQVETCLLLPPTELRLLKKSFILWFPKYLITGCCLPHRVRNRSGGIFHNTKLLDRVGSRLRVNAPCFQGCLNKPGRLPRRSIQLV